MQSKLHVALLLYQDIFKDIFLNSIALVQDHFLQRMALPCMYDQCKHMLYVSSELNRLQVSYEEYLCMKTLLLLSS
eukprot:bmy_20890T0